MSFKADEILYHVKDQDVNMGIGDRILWNWSLLKWKKKPDISSMNVRRIIPIDVEAPQIMTVVGTSQWWITHN